MFSAGFAGQGILIEDPTAWLDGARIHPKYVCKSIKIVMLPDQILLTKLYSDGNRSKVLYSKKSIPMT